MPSPVTRSLSLAQRVRRRARQILHGATERVVSLKWYGLRFFSPSTLSALHREHLSFFSDLCARSNHSDYKDMSVEAVERILEQTRRVTRDVRYHASTLARSDAHGRRALTDPLLDLARNYANIHRTGKRSGMPRKLRLLRQIIAVLVETSLAIRPPSSTRIYSNLHLGSPEPDMYCEVYGEIFREALEGGMPKVWLPLYKAFSTANIKAPPHRYQVYDVEKVATRGFLTYVSEEASRFHTVPTLHRHLALLKKHLPHKIPQIVSMVKGEHSLSYSPFSTLYRLLRFARTPRVYKDCLALWNKHGFPLESTRLWREMRHPHTVSSAFACALQYAKIDLNQSSFFITPSSSQYSLPSEGLTIANYVLPIFHEGETFLKQAGISLKDMKPLAPKDSPVLALLKKGESDVWSPWQHLAAYLSLGGFHSEKSRNTLHFSLGSLSSEKNTTPSPEALRTLLSLCEEAWGPPTTYQGTVEDFVAWHTTLLALRPPQESVVRLTDKIENVWQTYLDHQALKTTLEATLKTTPEETPSTIALPRRRL